MTGAVQLAGSITLTDIKLGMAGAVAPEAGGCGSVSDREDVDGAGGGGA